jgi:DNA (cytosine-5)-methyltransferase 1
VGVSVTHRIGSLCSGYEGLGLAVHEVLGGELAWVADNDPGAAAILAHRFPSVPNLGDITVTDWAAVEPVDILTAGFPCQDVSCAGGRAGLRVGNRTGVWAHVARAIDALRPSLVVLENVRGLLSAGADSDMELCPWCLGEAGDELALRASGAVLGDLADLGYDAQWVLVSAASAGAPHRRERVFFTAWPAADTAGGLRRALTGGMAEGEGPCCGEAPGGPSMRRARGRRG